MNAGNEGIRLSDRERELAAERLHQAVAEGRLTLAEVDERLAAVYAARFPADLEPLFADLPAPPTGGKAPVLRPPTSVEPAGQYVPLVLGESESLSPADFPPEPLVLKTGMGTIKRKHDWRVPGWLRVEVGAGSVVLNCVHARFDQQVTAIDLDVGMGTFKVIVPDGVTANIDRVSTASGTARSSIGALPTPGLPHLIFAGRVGMGSFVVRRPYFGGR